VDFGLSEEQLLLQQTVRDFIAREYPAKVRRDLFDSGVGHDRSLWQGLMELGVGGVLVPEAHGGAGLELLDAALISEVLGEAAFPGPYLGHLLATLAIARGGSDEQCERWLPALASGERMATVALAETAGAWDPEDWSASFENGRVHGAKEYVLAGRFADLIVVGLRGGELAVVERGAEGLDAKPFEGADRTRGLDQVRFDGTPAAALPRGSTAASAVRDAGLVLLSADAFGGASKLVEMCVEYSRTREQFGRPIGSFQAVKHQLADLAVRTEPSRGLLWYAAYAFDALPDEACRTVALAKAHFTDRYMQTARDAVELHGGIGFTWECDVQIWFKRALFDRAYLGTPDHHRERCARLAGW
jgi:alkylation response protein AidB-like acyl-CoA dehydrogenase